MIDGSGNMDSGSEMAAGPARGFNTKERKNITTISAFFLIFQSLSLFAARTSDHPVNDRYIGQQPAVAIATAYVADVLTPISSASSYSSDNTTTIWVFQLQKP